MVPMFRNHAELTGVCCELVTDSQREAGRSYTAASAEGTTQRRSPRSVATGATRARTP